MSTEVDVDGHDIRNTYFIVQYLWESEWWNLDHTYDSQERAVLAARDDAKTRDAKRYHILRIITTEDIVEELEL